MATKTLYVGNLPYEATEDGLIQFFSAYGPANARIIEGRGFGFVDIEDTRLDEAVTEKHNSEMNGRRLTVSESKPRPSGGAGRGGSRY